MATPCVPSSKVQGMDSRTITVTAQHREELATAVSEFRWTELPDGGLLSEDLIVLAQTEIEARKVLLVSLSDPPYLPNISVAVNNWSATVKDVSGTEGIRWELREFASQMEQAKTLGRMPGEYWAEIVETVPPHANTAERAKSITETRRILDQSTPSENDLKFVLKSLAQRTNLDENDEQTNLVGMWSGAASTNAITNETIRAEAIDRVGSAVAFGTEWYTIAQLCVVAGDVAVGQATKALAADLADTDGCPV